MSDHAHRQTSGHEQSGHSQSYLMFWLNMGLSLVVMYVVMFSMIDGLGDFRNNLNMFYMAITMWAPMGIFMGVSQTLLEAAITQPRPVFSCFVNLLQSEEARKQIILVIDGPAA